MTHHLRMLCVDDDLELRNSLSAQFTEEDFLVDLAEDGDIALKMIENNQYDIVLLDLKMPRMDGMAVLRELKKSSKAPHVIMLTAINDVERAQECIKLGAKDYITKPYDPEDLLHIVIRVLGA